MYLIFGKRNRGCEGYNISDERCGMRGKRIKEERSCATMVNSQKEK
jgi:hypothetical protein